VIDFTHSGYVLTRGVLSKESGTVGKVEAGAQKIDVATKAKVPAPSATCSPSPMRRAHECARSPARAGSQRGGAAKAADGLVAKSCVTKQSDSGCVLLLRHHRDRTGARRVELTNMHAHALYRLAFQRTPQGEQG
jgi:hypothetical protein